VPLAQALGLAPVLELEPAPVPAPASSPHVSARWLLLAQPLAAVAAPVWLRWSALWK
jgi:hypothetical protein